MRITGHRLIELQIAAARGAMEDVAHAGQVASTGMRVERPSEDPAAWLAARRADAHRAVHAGAGAAIASGTSRLEQTDGALGAIGDVLHRARELAIQGSNDTLSAADRDAIALELGELFKTALGAANQQSVDGEYLLAGFPGTTAPFDAMGTFVGDGGVRALVGADGQSHTMTISGFELTAAGGGVDVLPTLDRLRAALAAGDGPATRDLLDELDRGIEQVSLARAHTGALLGALVDADNVRSEHELALQKTIANAVEADYATAAGDLSRATNALEAVRAVAARVIAVVAPSR